MTMAVRKEEEIVSYKEEEVAFINSDITLAGTVKLRPRARIGPLDNGARAHCVANILGLDRP